MWQCPSCGRPFKNTNQSHSCKTYTLERHLHDKPGGVVALYHLLAGFAEELGNVEVRPMKSTILFRGETAFWSVSIHRTFVRVMFQLHRRLKKRRGWRETQASPGRFVYEVRLRSPDQLDVSLRDCLAEAARLGGVQSG